MLSGDVVEEFKRRLRGKWNDKAKINEDTMVGNGVRRRQREKGRGWCLRDDFETIKDKGYSSNVQMILGIEPRFFNLDHRKIWSI